MDLSQNQRKDNTAIISEDLIAATTYINTPIRQRTHRYREMKTLPCRALDRIWPYPSLNLTYLRHLNSCICRGLEPHLCLWP